jgi:hypothetical protein
MASTSAGANHGRMRTGVVLAAVIVALIGLGGAGAAAPPAFQLVFDGRHNVQLQHEGTFTANASWCPSGSVTELSVDSTTDTATRRFACSGGSDFTATVRPLPAEHGGGGTWRIVGGSGPLANLRGKGTFTSTLVSGKADDPATITFRSTWTGVADFDVDPPAITVASAIARRLVRPAGSYAVRVAVTLADSGGSISYVLQVVDPKHPAKAFVYRVGRASGIVAATARIKVPSGMRAVRLQVEATDPVGNSSTLSRTIRLH